MVCKAQNCLVMRLAEKIVLFCTDSQCCTVNLGDVIGVKPIKIPPKHSTLSLRKSHKVGGDVPVCIEMAPVGSLGFSIYVVARPGTGKWRYDQISFQCKDSSLCQQWISALKEALKSPGKTLSHFVFIKTCSTKGFYKCYI